MKKRKRIYDLSEITVSGGSVRKPLINFLVT